jgi:hypothetical protein
MAALGPKVTVKDVNFDVEEKVSKRPNPVVQRIILNVHFSAFWVSRQLGKLSVYLRTSQPKEHDQPSAGSCCGRYVLYNKFPIVSVY